MFLIRWHRRIIFDFSGMEDKQMSRKNCDDMRGKLQGVNLFCWAVCWALSSLLQRINARKSALQELLQNIFGQQYNLK